VQTKLDILATCIDILNDELQRIDAGEEDLKT